MSEFPDFTLPIDDRNAAEFWRDEWAHRFRETNDHAFKESFDAMQVYIAAVFDDDEDF